MQGMNFQYDRAKRAARCALFGTCAVILTAQPALAQENANKVLDEQEIVVTGTRLDHAGFDAPTPTTVVGAVDLRIANRPSIGQILNDLPQFRASSTPVSTVANTSSSTTTADLRGLGSIRTLTLLNGRRSIGVDDLNAIPLKMVGRVEIVTGGASAAWGSGAVSGVVNIILNDKLDGFNVGAETGISSRGDGFRYGAEAAYGTDFADGRGRFIVGGTYTKELGIRDRDSRKNIGSAALFTTTIDGVSTTELVRDVNFADASTGGLIVNGVLAGQTFSADGSLRPFVYGSPRTSSVMVGGEGISSTDEYPASAPYERYNGYARASFDLGSATVWADALYSNISAKYLFYSERGRGNLTMSTENPFLRPEIRDQLVLAGQDTFRMGRIFQDYGQRIFGYTRETIEGGFGVDGTIGDNWRYSAHYSHGTESDKRGYDNQRVTANFANAIDAVRDPVTNEIVCRVALSDPDTACRPLNIFGAGQASPEAVAYAFASAYGGTKETLDSGGFSLRGEPLSLWAGPVSIAVGGEARREAIRSLAIDPISQMRGFTQLNFSELKGDFSVKEAFGEIGVPLVDATGINIALNGAARYSDYSNTGGIWSWKLGATARLFDDLLIRATRSRDIRSPALSELYTTLTTTYSTVLDPVLGESVAVVRYGGGNANLQPEIAQTFTAGFTYSPKFVPSLKLSVDYYSIKVDDIIVTPSAQDIITRCYNGQVALCDQIERNGPGGAISTIYATYVNFAKLNTRGIDFEATYQLPLAEIAGSAEGSLRFRLLGTYVDTRETDDGITKVEGVGNVGDGTSGGIPRWRGTGSITYETDIVSLDARIRYVDGGDYNSALDIVNNKISSRTYLDIGAQFRIDKLTLFGTISNVFDRDPPITTYGQIHYDQIGRYFSFGANVKF